MSAEPDPVATNIAQAIAEISEHAALLIREEIELAKAEVTTKLMKLVRGAVVGLAAGIFLIVALLFALHGFAWLAAYELFPAGQVFWGYFLVAGALILFGVLAGLLAARALRGGAPPMPAMAIEEARKIRDAVGAPEGGH